MPDGVDSEAKSEALEGARDPSTIGSNQDKEDASAQAKSPSCTSSRPSSARQQQQKSKVEADAKNDASATQLEVALTGDLDANTAWAPTNTLAELEESDPNFQAYMKMLRRQNPQGKKLFRNKGRRRQRQSLRIPWARRLSS